MRPETEHDTRYLELMGRISKWQQTYIMERNAVTYWEDPVNANSYRAEESLARHTKRRDEASTEMQAAESALALHEADYTGWSRYFLVVSSAGLVHSHMRCSTCNKGRQNTEFALLPMFSGLAPAGLVEAFGPALCSVCFPEAPTTWTDQMRLPTSLTEILLLRGEEAFNQAHVEWKTKQAARAAMECAGSGTIAPPDTRQQRFGRSRYATCPVCNLLHPVTSNGKFRKHRGKK
jgi:hypothetical protein